MLPKRDLTYQNLCPDHLRNFFAPARSVGASYSESGVSNDLVSIHPFVVRDEKTSKTPNGICAGQTRNLQR